MTEQRSERRRAPRLGRWVVAVGVFLASAFVAQITSCNVHEIGHAAVGAAVGWEVERIDLCLPGGGGVEYGNIPTWGWNAQGYAGGLAAAVFLGVAYVVAVGRRRPEPGLIWSAVGLGIVPFIGPQLVLAVMEGSAGPGEDYTRLFEDYPLVLVPLMVVAAAAGVVAHLRGGALTGDDQRQGNGISGEQQ